MSHTNSTANIAMVRSDGTFKSIYLNWDGSPERAGQILLEWYTTTEEVEDLIRHGDLSSLGGCYELCDYYFDHEGESWDDVEPVITNSVFFMEMINGQHTELREENYLYIWDVESELWYIMDGTKTIQPLETY